MLLAACAAFCHTQTLEVVAVRQSTVNPMAMPWNKPDYMAWLQFARSGAALMCLENAHAAMHLRRFV